MQPVEHLLAYSKGAGIFSSTMEFPMQLTGWQTQTAEFISRHSLLAAALFLLIVWVNVHFTGRHV
jgi:hypothetical protein